MSFLNTYNYRIFFELQPDLEDTHIWQFSNTGTFSTKSAYEALFTGAILFAPWERIWHSWAPGKCRFFMWTVAHKKCWTADRLEKKGLSHPTACPLCDQDGETIDHLLVSCVFSRQVWFNVLQHLGLQVLAPQAGERSFEDWWASTSSRVSGQIQKGFNSIVILCSWTLWNHRNRCVFDGISPNYQCHQGCEGRIADLGHSRG